MSWTIYVACGAWCLLWAHDAKVRRVTRILRAHSMSHIENKGIMLSDVVEEEGSNFRRVLCRSARVSIDGSEEGHA